MKILAFFNNKGGVGKTTLVYHLAWMLADRGQRVLAVDLDPQANLTSMFLDEDRLEELWPGDQHHQTIAGAVRPIMRGIGDVERPHVESIAERLGLVVGDLNLSAFEDKLSDAWPRCHNRDESAFRIMSAFFRGVLLAAAEWKPDWVLVDVGPNLGAINRAALIGSEAVLIPLGPDLFSLQGLRNLGPTLQGWREAWRDMRSKNPDRDLALPEGSIQPIGYVVMQHGVRGSRPPQAYQKWIDRFPGAYRTFVLEHDDRDAPRAAHDPHCLAMLKHYRSLMPMAMEARLPVFQLRPAHGAIGAHAQAVTAAYDDFLELARGIGRQFGVDVS